MNSYFLTTQQANKANFASAPSYVDIRQRALAEEAVARANNKRIARIKGAVTDYGDKLLDSVGNIADNATEFIQDGADDVVDAVRGLPKPSARSIGLAAGGLGLAGAGAGLGGYLANRNKQSDMSRYMGNPVASFKRGVYREASFNKYPGIPDPWADNLLDRYPEIASPWADKVVDKYPKIRDPWAENVLDGYPKIPNPGADKVVDKYPGIPDPWADNVNAPKVVNNRARNIKQKLSKAVPKGRGMLLGGALGTGLAGLGAYKLLGNQKQYEG